MTMKKLAEIDIPALESSLEDCDSACMDLASNLRSASDLPEDDAKGLIMLAARVARSSGDLIVMLASHLRRIQNERELKALQTRLKGETTT